MRVNFSGKLTKQEDMKLIETACPYRPPYRAIEEFRDTLFKRFRIGGDSAASAGRSRPHSVRSVLTFLISECIVTLLEYPHRV